MGPYLAMLGAPGMCAVLGLGQDRRLARLNLLLLAGLFAAFAVLIGLRDEVGADWTGYLVIVRAIGWERLGTALSFYDPAFDLAAWVSTRLGWDVYGVDFACGLLLLAGVFRLARGCTDPWLALSAAVPYLLVVVGMGYIRQAAAIGLLMSGFVDLQHGRRLRFLLALAGALTFHVAALVLVPVVGLVLGRRSLVLLAGTAALGAAVAAWILAARLDGVEAIYVAGQLDSAGTLVRLGMTAIPAALFLALRARFAIPPPMGEVWTAMALVALALPAAFLVSPSSTAVDWIGLFFAPLQVVVFGGLAAAIGRGPGERQVVTMLGVAYCAAVLLGWLHFSFYARFWVPYRSVL